MLYSSISEQHKLGMVCWPAKWFVCLYSHSQLSKVRVKSGPKSELVLFAELSEVASIPEAALRSMNYNISYFRSIRSVVLDARLTRCT